MDILFVKHFSEFSDFSGGNQRSTKNRSWHQDITQSFSVTERDMQRIVIKKSRLNQSLCNKKER